MICKYQQTDTIDGTSYAILNVDKYPANGRDNDPRAFVQTVDLVGGNATYQHQDVVTQNLPVSATGTATLPWLKAHIPWLFGTLSAPTSTIPLASQSRLIWVRTSIPRTPM